MILEMKESETLRNVISVDLHSHGMENEINLLYNQVFACSRSIEQWKWEYLDNPHGESLIGLLKEDDKIIGHFALLPFKMSNEGQEILTGKTEGLMLAEEYRRRGHFTNLAQACMPLAKERGFEVVWVTFTPATQSLERAGYKKVLKLYHYVYPNDCESFSNLSYSKLRFNVSMISDSIFVLWKHLRRQSSSVSLHETKLHDYVSFYERWRTYQTRFSPSRDYEFMKWKFLDNPYQLSASFLNLKYKNTVIGMAIAVQKGKQWRFDDFMLLPEFEGLVRESLLRPNNSCFSEFNYTSVVGNKMFRHFRSCFLGELYANPLNGNNTWLQPDNWYFTGLYREGIS